MKPTKNHTTPSKLPLQEGLQQIKDWGKSQLSQPSSDEGKTLTIRFHLLRAQTTDEMASLIAQERAKGNSVGPVMAVVCERLE